MNNYNKLIQVRERVKVAFSAPMTCIMSFCNRNNLFFPVKAGMSKLCDIRGMQRI